MKYYIHGCYGLKVIFNFDMKLLKKGGIKRKIKEWNNEGALK